MIEENYRSANSLTEGMEEIITRLQSDSEIANAFLSNKKFYSDFNIALSELNDLISGTEEPVQESLQISLF